MTEQRLVRIIKKTIPAVVSIVASHHLEELEHGLLPGRKGGTAAERKELEDLADAEGLVETGGGSGFIVHADGLILTNRHVVGDVDAEYTVVVKGKPFPAEIISRDPLKDIAVLKIKAQNLPSIPLGSSRALRLGQTAIAIGNALGMFENTVSIGIISGLSRSIRAQETEGRTQEMRGLIQTDAAINPGNSGGPLINAKGEVIGINAATVSNAQSISFAVPIDTARRDLEEIKQHGHICRPYLGLRYIVTDAPFSTEHHLPETYGAWVTGEHPRERGVIPKSPAEKAGIRNHDLILEWNGRKITRENPLADFLEESPIGKEIKLLILRGSEKIETTVVLQDKA